MMWEEKKRVTGRTKEGEEENESGGKLEEEVLTFKGGRSRRPER